MLINTAHVRETCHVTAYLSSARVAAAFAILAVLAPGQKPTMAQHADHRRRRHPSMRQELRRHRHRPRLPPAIVPACVCNLSHCRRPTHGAGPVGSGGEAEEGASRAGGVFGVEAGEERGDSYRVTSRIEGTWEPLHLLVEVPMLPKACGVEVQVIAATAGSGGTPESDSQSDDEGAATHARMAGTHLAVLCYQHTHCRDPSRTITLGLLPGLRTPRWRPTDSPAAMYRALCGV